MLYYDILLSPQSFLEPKSKDVSWPKFFNDDGGIRYDPTSAQRLYDDLFKTYRKELRPVRNYLLPVNISMQLWFMQVLRVDEIDQVLKIYCWIEEVKNC